jgi:hypothetical protein
VGDGHLDQLLAAVDGVGGHGVDLDCLTSSTGKCCKAAEE